MCLLFGGIVFTVYLVLLPPCSLCTLFAVILSTVWLLWWHPVYCVSCLVPSCFCCTLFGVILFFVIFPSCLLCVLISLTLSLLTLFRFTVYIVWCLLLLLHCASCLVPSCSPCALFGLMCPVYCVPGFSSILLSLCLLCTLFYCHAVHYVTCLVSSCSLCTLFYSRFTATLFYCHSVPCVTCLVASCSLCALFDTGSILFTASYRPGVFRTAQI